MTTARSPAFLALVALGLGGCNALLGLGGTPTAEEGEATAGTGGAPTTTSTGAGGSAPAPASSGAGGDGGDGAGGAAGAGGEGGGPSPGPPCGPCDGDAACGPGGVCVGGSCATRVVPLEGGGRVVEGIAVSPSTVVVGAADGAVNVTFHFVDRATWQVAVTSPQNVPIDGVLAPGPDVRAYYAPNGAAVVLPIDPDGFAGPIQVVDALRGLAFAPGPTPAGSLLGVAWSDGRVVRVDLAAPSETCLLAGPQGDAAADLAVRRDGAGEVIDLAWSLSGMLAAPALVESGAPTCDAMGEVRMPIEGVDALGTVTLGDGFAALRTHRAGDPAGSWTAWSSSADAATRATNAGWGLTAVGDGVLVPGVDAGLDRCDADLVTCADAAPGVALGAVQDVAITGDALLITDVVGSEARLVCLARSGAALR